MELEEMGAGKTRGQRFLGAVFDLDGLLIDSEPIWMWAQSLALEELGGRLTLAIQLDTTGLRLNEAILKWRGHFPGLEIDSGRLRSRLIQLVSGKIADSAEAKPGALRSLGICREAGCRLAIASSSMPEIIEAALERLQAKTLFDAVVSAEGEDHGKPHPAVYLSAAARLGLDPGDCIAFEDSVFGLRSAKSAGMHCIAVPEEHNRTRPEYGIADRVLLSLEDLLPEHLHR